MAQLSSPQKHQVSTGRTASVPQDLGRKSARRKVTRATSLQATKPNEPVPEAVIPVFQRSILKTSSHNELTALYKEAQALAMALDRFSNSLSTLIVSDCTAPDNPALETESGRNQPQVATPPIAPERKTRSRRRYLKSYTTVGDLVLSPRKRNVRFARPSS